MGKLVDEEKEKEPVGLILGRTAAEEQAIRRKLLTAAAHGDPGAKQILLHHYHLRRWVREGREILGEEIPLPEEMACFEKATPVGRRMGSGLLGWGKEVREHAS